MPASQSLEEKIRLLDQAGLRRLYTDIVAGDPPGWAAGKALEYLVLRAFEIAGADVIWPYDIRENRSIVEQIDGVIYLDGLAVLLECKDRSAPINFEPMAKLRQQLSRRPPSVIGCCFALNGFTPSARLLTVRCSPQNVLLWSGPEIEYALEKEKMREALRLKYRHSVEQALPDFKTSEIKSS